MIALRTLIFTMLGPGTVLGVVPWLLLRWEGTAVLPIPAIWLIGLLPLLLGVGLYLWCAGGVHLHRPWNASTYGCSEIPGESGTVSLGAQSDVSCSLSHD
jgi:hypothetical protein